MVLEIGMENLNENELEINGGDIMAGIGFLSQTAITFGMGMQMINSIGGAAVASATTAEAGTQTATQTATASMVTQAEPAAQITKGGWTRVGEARWVSAG